MNAAAITTSGVITNSQTWMGVVSLTGDVTVATNGNLTILPGTRVRCDARADDQVGGLNNSRIEILVLPGGVLTAVGTETTPILFTSWPLTPGQETNGDWYGLRLASTNATLQYCTIEYAMTGLSIEDGPPMVDHCVMRNSEGSGLSASVSGEASNCTFTQNRGAGAYLSGASFAFYDSMSSSNSGAGISVYYTATSITCSNCTVSFNNAGVVGYSGFIRFINGRINNNTGNGLSGGPGSITVIGSDIFHNGIDGGFYTTSTYGIEARGDLTLFNSQVRDCSGGGIYIYADSTIVVSNTVLKNNQGIGGMAGSSRYGVMNCSILSNSITGNSVGSSISGGTISYVGNLIQGNNFGLQAGGTQVITNNLIFGNVTYDLQNNGAVTQIADGNYWGEPTTTELANGVRNLTKIYDSRDQVGLGQVVIHTWDATPNGVLVAPSIAIQPQNLAAPLGGGAAFSVLAGGSPPLFYQWTRDGAPVLHATNFSLALGTVTTTNLGGYQVVITNSYGSVTSVLATLTQAKAASVPVLGAQLFAGLTLGGEVGRNYTIQYTFDLHPGAGLINWTALTTLVLPSSPFTYIDLTAPVDRPRFYRAFLSP